MLSVKGDVWFTSRNGCGEQLKQMISKYENDSGHRSFIEKSDTDPTSIVILDIPVYTKYISTTTN